MPVRRVSAAELDRAAGGRRLHQGVVAEVGGRRRTRRRSTWRIWSPARPRRRSSSCSTASRIRTTSARFCGRWTRRARTASCGSRGTRRRSAAAAAKASAGAVAHVRIAEVVNIARALEELKEAGVWTVGLAGDGPTRYDEIDLTLPTAVVRGRRGDRAAAAGAGAVRLAGVDPDARPRRQPERVGGGRGRAVRGRPPAPEQGGWLGHTAIAARPGPAR